MLKIAIGCDHAGYEMKQSIIHFLENRKIHFKDFGTYSIDSVDYPDYAHAVANAVENSEYDLGILICGSGNGINMAANKHQGIRAALCWHRDIAEMARLHNNANILSLPGRYIDFDEAIACVDIFLTTQFEGGRHQKRIDKIMC
jgi:ribose 5-phosphate isomerase B